MGKVDKSRITTDFYASFPDVGSPSLSSPSNTIPGSGTITGGDYELSSWTVSGNLRITGDTRIVVSGDIKLSGNVSIVIDSSATVEIYVQGDVAIAGNGILNSSQVPAQLLVFGTNTTEGGQDIKISGNGYLSGAVYAPNAVVTLNGGGNSGRVYGAVAGYDAKLTGNSHFSYDEALEGYNLGGSGYVIEEWAELSGVSLTILRMNMADYGFLSRLIRKTRHRVVCPHRRGRGSGRARGRAAARQTSPSRGRRRAGCKSSLAKGRGSVAWPVGGRAR